LVVLVCVCVCVRARARARGLVVVAVFFFLTGGCALGKSHAEREEETKGYYYEVDEDTGVYVRVCERGCAARERARGSERELEGARERGFFFSRLTFLGVHVCICAGQKALMM